MLDINPKGITPLGPYPEVEAGVLSPDDWKNLTPGGVKMKEVVKYAQTLPMYVISILLNPVLDASLMPFPLHFLSFLFFPY